ncbi:hypothetical protein CKO11_09835 [Rhodobacter sp. TJ_12]|uniref:SH3 domain-containing protein n=1 Tax=Rhodobacter sp. TJ_12 TaxID=2029399 RepID=UPI001CC1AAC9|nr:SH3 domain-containing protein [Rhodobacter sp. TJ_12]MBZ4022758.1 hypothetical protein [Rhodobacter sp. TJ_12]
MTFFGLSTQFSCATIAALRSHWAGFAPAAGFAIAFALAVSNPITPAQADTTANSPRRGPVTNLPLPRFVSLKGDEGNARRGPSLSHRIDWVFKHAGMPLRITAEHGHWRRVEDRDGAGGWVHYSLLSGVRMVIVEDDMTELHARPEVQSPVVALAEMGALARLGDCTRTWCEISAEDADGWVPKEKIWGVTPDEIRD